MVRVLALPAPDVQGQVPGRGEGTPELLGQLRVEDGGMRGQDSPVSGEAKVVGQRNAGKVEGDLDAGRQRRQHRRKTADAPLVAQRLGQAGAEHDADVLDRVVRIDVQVAPGVQREVERGVPPQLLDHVVEEREPGRDVDDPGAVEGGPRPRSWSPSSPALPRGTAAGSRFMTGSPPGRSGIGAVLVRPADRDPQAAAQPVPAGAVADEHGALEQPAPHLVHVVVQRAEEDAIGIRGPALDRQGTQPGRHPAPLLGRRRHTRASISPVYFRASSPASCVWVERWYGSTTASSVPSFSSFV